MVRIPDKRGTKTKRKESKLFGSEKDNFQGLVYYLHHSFYHPKKRGAAVLKHAASNTGKAIIAKAICID